MSLKSPGLRQYKLFSGNIENNHTSRYYAHCIQNPQPIITNLTNRNTILSPYTRHNDKKHQKSRLCIYYFLTRMNTLLSIIAFIFVPLPFIASAAIYCDGPHPATCINGLWNEDRCKCECIPPFCPDIFGTCSAPLNNCGGNPWVNCVRGKNCPWWRSLLRAESCTTGPDVSSLLIITFSLLLYFYKRIARK